MTSMGELFPKCRKLAYDARQQLASMQQYGSAVSVSDLYLSLEELNRQLATMDELVIREVPEKRPRRKREIEELRIESARLAQECQRVQQEQQRSGGSYERQRQELLRRRRTRQGGGAGDSEMQHLAEESQSLEQSSRMVMDLMAQGQHSLGSLQDQRGRLRGIKRVVFDIGNRLGVSQSTMKIIERRDITDAYFVAAGMVVTCLVIYFVWF